MNDLMLVYVTQSEKTNLISYFNFKVTRNVGLKYSVFCSAPMVDTVCTKFSHVLHQLFTFKNILCTRMYPALKFPTILDRFQLNGNYTKQASKWGGI